MMDFYWDSRSLQELLLRLLPVGVEERLRHQLHQLQAVLNLHQQLKIIPSTNLHTGAIHKKTIVAENFTVLKCNFIQLHFL